MESEDRLDKLFFALADSRRRHMLNLLSENAIPITLLAQHFDSSLATVSKNLSLLEKCGLIYKVKKGRTVYCHMNFDTWIEVAKYISLFAQFWSRRLNELESYIEIQEEK